MQKIQSIRWRQTGVLFLLSMLFVTLLTSVAVVYAQDDPQPTPADPVWRAFRVVRDAVEEEFSTDLTYVRSYTYEQNIWDDSIDTCDSEILENDWRDYYTGWTFRIVDLNGTQYQVRVSFNLEAVTICDEVTASEGPDVDAGEDVDVNLPDPVAGSGATGAFELGGHVLSLGADTANAMRSAGMTWVKKQLRFSLGDGTGLAQSFIDSAQSNGFRILLGIVGDPNQMGDYDNYVSQYADFVGRVAALGPDAIEVWNEPNIAREWPQGTISGARYTQMLAAAFNSIKAANPNVMVISGAPAPTGAEQIDPSSIMNDDRFMAQMAEAGAANYMDCVGLHYNEGVVAPSASSGDPRDNYPTRYFGSMLARGSIFPDRPVCWTEIGYLTGEGFNQALPGSFAWAGDVSVAEQAAWLAEAATLSAQSGVRLMIVWNVNFEQFAGDPMGGFAMIRPDGSCPACDTLGTVMGG